LIFIHSVTAGRISFLADGLSADEIIVNRRKMLPRQPLSCTKPPNSEMTWEALFVLGTLPFNQAAMSQNSQLKGCSLGKIGCSWKRIFLHNQLPEQGPGFFLISGHSALL